MLCEAPYLGITIDQQGNINMCCNTMDREQFGVKISDVDNLEKLLTTCSELHLPVVGLMCIPPISEDPYPHFEALRLLKEKYGLSELSMGMSNDFEKAISAGASFIRVGSAIFGQRP